jgi:hypothetical protein
MAAVTSHVVVTAAVVVAVGLLVFPAAASSTGSSEEELIAPAELRFVSRSEQSAAEFLHRLRNEDELGGSDDDVVETAAVATAVGLGLGGFVGIDGKNVGLLAVVEDKYLSKLSEGEDLGIGIFMTCIGEL